MVKAFSTTFAGTLLEGQVAGQPLDVFIASDDEEAKATVGRLASDGGLRPVDVEPLRRARELEHWATCTWPCNSHWARALPAP